MKRFIYFLAITLSAKASFSAEKVFNLTISPKQVNYTGEPREALAINDQVPAPTLRFKEGDDVVIHVYNLLPEATAIHWHGVLLPWVMDGVENITQYPIKPGDSFTYKFKAHQSGTYWYHAHAGLQEQQGMYGAIIIDPAEPEPYKYNKEHVIVLSDWSDTDPEQVFANLKKKGDFYAPRLPLQPSLNKYLTDIQTASPAQRKKLDDSYAMMQQMRMSIYDISDVAYDAFLLNGRTRVNPWTALVKPGDTVRLRFIGAMGSTRYRVKIPGTQVSMVHVQGKDVAPKAVDDFTISPGETIDVLVSIGNQSPYVIYAESADTLGSAVGALITSPDQVVDYNVRKFPEPEPVMMGHHMGSHGMNMGGMDHGSMHMGNEESLTTGTKYQDLKASYVTNDPEKPVTEINMELYGYMGRFIWFINGKTEHEAEPIRIEPGKRYRLIFTNESMMHHPMHLHGHFMILRNGHGEYDPLVHTIEVPPGAHVVADFDADVNSGQWFFHCHHLFHMVSGMARTFQYSTIKQDAQAAGLEHLAHHPMAHPMHMHQALFLDLGYDPFHNVQKGNLYYLAGWDYDRLQLYSEDAEVRHGKVTEADLDVFYWHLISEFWAIKGGLNIVYKPAKHTYVQPGVGIEGLMPYFIDTDLRLYVHKSSFKADLQLSRDTQITNNFFIRTGIRGKAASKLVKDDDVGKGLYHMEYILRPYYTVSPNVAVFTEFNYQEDLGILRRIHRRERESYRETVATIGLSLLY